ncbi:MAG: cytidine deaminase [Chloroflexi bacterium]|nr:cytidine deaminase [Chloroflexota bacterium]MBT3670078.1 cytidine deaminase [Chloroflexota bacterium]MBT4002229.1 cytidine deaminase [Chloroflexota bacterium]MBT4306720.1 cytidine deaminase [Chloroflexota bacterium]MBT4532964.1 cytidine deaminase [Chloroflexota bacterium]
MKMENKVSKQDLIAMAMEARKKSYSPYSRYPVGAALLTKSGKVFQGTNIENAAYSCTICAERTAIFKAIYEGEREFEAIAVVTKDGGSPCGSCRQVLSEFGLDTIVWLADENGDNIQESTVEELIPLSFGPSNLLE